MQYSSESAKRECDVSADNSATVFETERRLWRISTYVTRSLKEEKAIALPSRSSEVCLTEEENSARSSKKIELLANQREKAKGKWPP